MAAFSNTRFYLIVTVAFFTAIGCEDTTINPFDDTSQDYSIYGALDINADRNFIRIKDVTTPLLADSNLLEPFVVTFEDLASGAVTTLEDTLVMLRGNPTKNFILENQLEPRKQYRLHVEGAEGKFSTSTLTTPGVATHSYSPQVTQSCFEPITFEFSNVQAPEYVRLEVGVHYNGGTLWAEVRSVDQLKQIEGTDKTSVSLSVRNLLVDVFPPIAEGTVGVPPRFWTPTQTCNDLDDGVIQIRYIHYGPDWDSIRDVRRDIPILESGEVENGLGFLGAISTGEFTFITNGVFN